MKRLLGLALAASLLFPATALAFDGAITLNASDPHYGDSITFDVTYPQEAAKQGRTPQFPDNPVVQVNCYQSGVLVYLSQAIVADHTKDKIPGGWSGVTIPVNLDAYSPWDGNAWLGGAADCRAYLFYATYDKDAGTVVHIVASMTFSVAA